MENGNGQLWVVPSSWIYGLRFLPCGKWQLLDATSLFKLKVNLAGCHCECDLLFCLYTLWKIPFCISFLPAAFHFLARMSIISQISLYVLLYFSVSILQKIFDIFLNSVILLVNKWRNDPLFLGPMFLKNCLKSLSLL